MVLFAVEASAVSSGRPYGVYMFSGLPTLVFNIHNITSIIHDIPNLNITTNNLRHKPDSATKANTRHRGRGSVVGR